jgi:hypothetical protein
MRKYIVQILEEIQQNPKTIENYTNDVPLKTLFEYSFLPEKKMILPEGTPPYTPAPEPLGMTPTNLFTEMRKLYIFCRADLTPLKRETLFISFIEGLKEEEAKIIIAAKDQTLHKLYPKITRKLVSDAGFIPPLPKKVKESATS